MAAAIGVMPTIATEGITKRFPGVLANDHVDFEAAGGEVHALLGENGAGKTTLSHILTGLYRPDEGRILLDGRPVVFSSPREALEAGVCMVHQHVQLVERFTVAENLVLGDQRGAGRTFRIDRAAVEDQVRELGERYRLPVDPRAHVWQLSIGEKQRVEILNALYRHARVMILDEPTAALTPNEADSLFATLRDIAGEGRTVVFISHKLHEVTAVSDRITVLRAGHKVATVRTADSTSQSLAALMVGHDIEVGRRPQRPRTAATGLLEVEDLWAEGDRGAPAVKGVTLRVAAGEILAIAGVAGNGQRELAETITGLRPRSRGAVRVDGVLLRSGDVRAAYDAGIGFVPEDRLGTGVSPNLSIAMNLELRSFRHQSFGPLLRLGRMRERAIETIKAYDIKTPGPETKAASLSGGNLQKLVIARELSERVRVLVVASPTRGLDIGAVETVHAHLLETADRGTAILMISEDLNEILALNDRVMVMYEGTLSDVGADETVEQIGLRMAGEMPLAAQPAPP